MYAAIFAAGALGYGLNLLFRADRTALGALVREMKPAKKPVENYIVDPARLPHLGELTSAAEFETGRSVLPQSLDELELLLRRDLDLTRYPARPWALPHMAPDGEPALDVLIVGGGQAGLTAAFGLLQQRVTNILVIDENPEGQEGPWGTYARMPIAAHAEGRRRHRPRLAEPLAARVV